MNTLAKSTNSRSMRYTCLDVRSPDVNFLRKVMSSSRHDGAAYSRHPCRQSADADIVSAFPLSFSTFLENINILRLTSSTWHRILREFYVLESFQKPPVHSHRGVVSVISISRCLCCTLRWFCRRRRSLPWRCSPASSSSTSADPHNRRMPDPLP